MYIGTSGSGHIYLYSAVSHIYVVSCP